MPPIIILTGRFKRAKRMAARQRHYNVARHNKRQKSYAQDIVLILQQ